MISAVSLADAVIFPSTVADAARPAKIPRSTFYVLLRRRRLDPKDSE